MRVVARYSIKNGEAFIKEHFNNELREVYEVIESIDAANCKTKISKEKTMKGVALYSPVELNRLFREKFEGKGWRKVKVKCKYVTNYYEKGYHPPMMGSDAYREMDFVKNKLGIEVQLGKYAFMVYNVCAKMTIFSNLKKIIAGIEIVPVKHLQQHMSTGVSYFEQFVWDLRKRGTADIDIPVLVLGVDV